MSCLMPKSSKMFGEKFLVKKAVKYEESAQLPLNAEESNRLLSKRVVTMVQVDNVIQQMLGEVLTIVDAGFDDSERKKAFKDLIRNSVYDALDSFHALSDDQKLA